MKCNSREMLPIFAAEADQLALLARSKTVKVPEVYGVGSDRDYSFLLLEYLPLKPLDQHSAYLLGQQLSALHQWSEQLQFGLDFDNELATLPQPNSWQKRWSSFFAEQRIGWQLQLAAEKGMVFGNIEDITEKVRARLHNHQPQPSLLHGDLWPHNCALSEGGPGNFRPGLLLGRSRMRFRHAAFISQRPQLYLRWISKPYSPSRRFHPSPAGLPIILSAQSQ